ncbi:substrate-binding periplasmic protein [Chromobacterium subtsugae]|uniref:substrate-binding periplasmic protein n=1 Tax=Chromobacterium subtsugae TaxID=251747 RepID=UPI000A42A3E1|nr:transporter substrate-binding domain-containing protein [Chromobacterium subtsugae]
MKTLLALLLSCLGLLAQPALASDNGPRPLVLAYNAFAPWKNYDGQGQPSGPYTEIVRELARRLRLPLRFLNCPLPRCLAAMQQGRADLMIGVQHSPQRARYLDYLEPPFASGNRLALYQRGNDPRVIRRYQDLLPLTVGVVDGVQYQEAFDQDPRLRRDTALTMESSFRKLAAGRIDVLIGNEQQTGLLAASHEFAGRVRRAGLTLDDLRPHRLALAQNSPFHAEKARFSQALQAMLDDGSVARILAGLPLRPAAATPR